MIFDKAFEVERACGKDPSRQGLHNIMLDVAAKRLIAVDGHMLASVPCEPTGHDHTGLVTPEALKAARKAAGKRGTPMLDCNGALTIPAGAAFPRPSEDNVGKFPPVEAVIPEYREGTEGTITVGLDAFKLAELAKCIGSDGQVSLTFKVEAEGKYAGTVSAYLVQSIKGDPNAIGVLMPVGLKK